MCVVIILSRIFQGKCPSRPEDERRNIMTKFDDAYHRFDACLSVVASYFQVDKSKVLTSNEEDCVNARYCLIYTMCEKYHDSDIAKISGLSKSCVNKIRNNTKFKLEDYSFRSSLKGVRDLLLLK